MLLPAMMSLALVAAPPTDTIRVGHPSLAFDALAPGVETVVNFVIVGGERRPLASFVQTVRETPAGFLVIQENRRPSGDLMTLDSIEVARGTLATLWHGEVTPQGRRHVSFRGGRILGIAIDSAGVETVIDQDVPPRLFDYSLFSMITSLLPLGEGYSATVATYDIARGPQDVPIRVRGAETITVGGATHDAWVVDTQLAPEWTVTRWLDRGSSRMIRWFVQSGDRQMLGEAR